MAGPGIVSKAALTVGRIAHYPFDIPMKLDVSATNVGEAGHMLVGGINSAVASAYMKLEPKGPAKLLVPLFVKTDEAVKNSQAIAARNKQVFWDPVSVGADKLGTALTGPLAYVYAKSAGFPDPGNPELLSALLHSKGYPAPPPPQAQGGGGEPAAPQGGGGEPAAAPPQQ